MCVMYMHMGIYTHVYNVHTWRETEVDIRCLSQFFSMLLIESGSLSEPRV